MARRRSSKNTARWSPILFFTLLSALLFASDEPHLGAFVALTLLIPYVVLFAPLRCRALTQKGLRCKNGGVGIFIGCHLHRFDYLARIFTRRRPVRRAPVSRASVSRASAGARSGGLPAVDSGVNMVRVAYEVATLAVAVVSMVAGVWAAIEV